MRKAAAASTGQRFLRYGEVPYAGRFNPTNPHFCLELVKWTAVACVADLRLWPMFGLYEYGMAVPFAGIRKFEHHNWLHGKLLRFC